MTDIGFGMQGTLRTIPKVIDVKADDGCSVVYKTSGNKRITPILWGTNHTMTGGADTVVASGVKFLGLSLVDYCNCSATVVSGTQDGYVYLSKDVDNNVITLKSTGSNTIGVDIQWFFGADATSLVF